MKKLLRFALTFILIFALVMFVESVLLPSMTGGLTTPAEEPGATLSLLEEERTVDEDGVYTTKEDLALYIHTYGHLPGNFVTKSEAEAVGWNGGSVESVLPGKCIGGDRFGNREGLLPKRSGRK